MKIFIIAQIVDNSSKNVVGYRLLDLDNKNQVQDYTIPVIKNVLAQSQTADIIKNAKLVNGVITGTNGQLSRYAKVTTNGMLVGASPLVVINKIDNVGYTVSDFKGVVIKMKTSDVVDYAKKQGIANGKVVIQDDVEYVSSISDSYEQISISPSKTGRQGKVNIDIHIDKDAASVAKHAENDINTEIQYNDVFSAMTKQQREVLKQFYTWYTVNVYKGLAKNVRLNLAPGKAEKLAQLRGIDKWKFAGINDSYLEGRFDAKCELGHNLRYEYFALPEDDTEGSSIRTKEWGGYAFRTSKSSRESLRDMGAIVFGETCASDFFNIAPDDMKKLVKTRKIMSEEIELMADIITNKTEEIYKNKCKFLYDAIKEMNSTESVVKVFGEQVAYTLLSFIKVQLPFPKSLVLLAGEAARKNKNVFFEETFKEYADILDRVIDTNSKVRHSAYISVNNILDFIVNNTIEGAYQYDPINDTENSRRDIGAYNKKTRDDRYYTNKEIFVTSLLSADKITSSINDIECVKRYFNCVKIAITTCDEVEKFISTSTELANIANERFTRTIVDFMQSSNNVIDDSNLMKFNALISSLSYSTKYTSMSYFTSKIIAAYGSYKTKQRTKNLEELESILGEIQGSGSISNFIDSTLGAMTEQIKQKDKEDKEREFNKEAYFLLDFNERTPEYAEYLNKPCIAIAKCEVKARLRKLINNEEILTTIVNVYGDKTINSDSIRKLSEIPSALYSLKRREYDECFRKEERERRISEKAERDARLAAEKEDMLKRAQAEREALLEKEKKDKELAEQKQKEEFESDEKMKKLQELINQHTELSNDYGVNVSKDILERKIPYSKLSSKQKWRVDETIKQLGGTVDTEATVSTEAPAKQKLDDNKEVKDKVEKLYEILKGNDAEAKKKVESASRIAFDIARTIKYKGEYSEKQLKHIEKAYDAIK